MTALMQVVGTVSSCICNSVVSMVPSPSVTTTALASPRRSAVPALSYFNNRAAATTSNLYELVRGIGEGKCTQAAVLNGDVETQSCRDKDMNTKTEVQPAKREKSKGEWKMVPQESIWQEYQIIVNGIVHNDNYIAKNIEIPVSKTPSYTCKVWPQFFETGKRG